MLTILFARENSQNCVCVCETVIAHARMAEGSSESLIGHSMVPALHFIKNGVAGWLTGTDRRGKKQEVTVSVAKLCQRDGLNGFRPLVNLFSNVLTFPQPPPPLIRSSHNAWK